MLQTFPAALRILNTVSTVLGAQDSLESINTTTLMDRSLVSCAANNSIYMLRKDSTEAPSGEDVVAPAQGGTGRWFLYSSGGGGRDGGAVRCDWCIDATGVTFAVGAGPIYDVVAEAGTWAAVSTGDSLLVQPAQALVGVFHSGTPAPWYGGGWVIVEKLDDQNLRLERMPELATSAQIDATALITADAGTGSGLYQVLTPRDAIVDTDPQIIYRLGNQTSAIAYVDQAQLLAAPTGKVLYPYETIQQGIDGGSLLLSLAPGTYAGATVPPGSTLLLEGSNLASAVGTLTASGGAEIVASQCLLAGCNFTDNNISNFYASVDSVETGPTINVGQAGGIGGAYEAQLTEYQVVVNVTNVSTLILDDYSERSFFATGGKVSGPVAGPVALQTNGAQGYAVVLVNRDETLTMTKRAILGRSQITAARVLTVTPSAQVGQVLTIDSYNHSGFTVDVKLGGSTIFTIPTSATASRYRLKTTVASTTWVLDSIEQLV